MNNIGYVLAVANNNHSEVTLYSKEGKEQKRYGYDEHTRKVELIRAGFRLATVDKKTEYWEKV